MNCQAVRDRLMQGESMQVKDWPRGMNRHLKECPTCAKLARNLYKLEDAWRNQPIPEECEAAKATFLDKLHSMAAPPQVETAEKPDTVKFEQPEKPRKVGKQKGSPKPARRQPGSMRWAALAAMVLIGITVVAVMFATNNQAKADSDIVERLIDFNLTLTNSEPSDRKKVYEKQAADLKKALEKARPILTKEDLILANELFEASGFLAENDKAVDEAKRITAISDELLKRAEAAESSGNKKQIERFGGRYAKFWNEGVSPMQKGASPLFKKFKGFDPEKYGKNGFEKITPPDKGSGGSGFQKGIGFEVGPDFDWEAYIQQQRLLAMIYMQSMQYARPQVHLNFNLLYMKGRGGRH